LPNLLKLIPAQIDHPDNLRKKIAIQRLKNDVSGEFDQVKGCF